MILELDSYYLDAIQEKDAWAICNFAVANEDRLKTFFPKTLEQNLTPNLSRLFVEKKVKQFQNKEEFLFTLKEKETNQFVGLIYIKELDWNKRQGEFAYCIGYQFKGKGIISNAVKALTDYSTETLGLSSFQIITHKTNLASIKVAQNCGFQWIKTLANEFTPAGRAPMNMELYELRRPSRF